MGITTTQQILRYYELYRDTEIIFSKEVLNVLRIDPRQIYIKCNGVQWACIINSSSLMSARIIVGTKGGAYAAIQKENTSVSLRFYFVDNHGKAMSFFVNTRITNIEAYMNSNDLAIATLSFNSKPPDDLIETLGRLLEAKTNSMNRTEERIPINADSKRRLSLVKEESLVFVQNVPRNCIIRNLSFSGANVLMMGIPKFLEQKETILRLEFEDPPEFINIKGTVVKVENIEGRKDLVALAMKFNEATTPISYKMHVNTCLTTVRKKVLNAIENFAEQPQSIEKNDSEKPTTEQTENKTNSEKTTEQTPSTDASIKTPIEEVLEIKSAKEKMPPIPEDTSTKTAASENKVEPTAQENPIPKPQGR